MISQKNVNLWWDMVFKQCRMVWHVQFYEKGKEWVDEKVREDEYRWEDIDWFVCYWKDEVRVTTLCWHEELNHNGNECLNFRNPVPVK